MITIYTYSIISVVLVSLVSLVGVFTLSLSEKKLKKNTYILVSLAVGALLGGAFIHLIPESFEEIQNPTIVSLEIIGGIILFFIMEKFLHWHHGHHEDAHGKGCEHECADGNAKQKIAPVGYMILIADGAHNFIDGIVIGASYMISIEAGIATTLAIILHEIPQEISDFGVLIHAGYTKARALWVNFLSAITAVAGTVLVLVAGSFSESLTVWLPPIAAGSFIYIAMSDLIPEMHKQTSTKHSLLQIFFVFVGVGVMLAMLLME